MTRSDRSLLKLNIPTLMALALLVASMMAQVQAPKAPKAQSTTTATTSSSTTAAATSLSAKSSSTTATTSFSTTAATSLSTTAATPSPATSSAGSLVFSQKIGNYIFSCNVDASGNPSAECFNSMAYICNPAYFTFDKMTCKNGVNQMFGHMNNYWQSVRQECGQWSWYGFIGNPSSEGCASANSALQQNGYYLALSPLTGAYDRIGVTEALTNALTVKVWNNSITAAAATTRSGGLVFSQKIGSYIFTCNVDASGNPYQDCMNIMAFMCNSTKSAEYNAQSCRLAVDKIFAMMNTYWQSVRQECGQWSWYGFIGNPSSEGCASANSALKQNGYYLALSPLTGAFNKIQVTAAMIESLKVRVWNNIALKEAVFCGESATMYPPTVFPPFNTSDDCLASGPAPSLEKRTLGTLSLVFTYTAIRGYIFTCHKDETGNPSADCLNTVAKICSLQPFDKDSCRDATDKMFGALNQKWQTFREECGSWPWNGITGDPSSKDCDTAKTDLETNTFYLLPSKEKVQTFPGLTHSLIVRLWKNPALIG